MTQQEFNAKATELIKAMVNAIADKDFSRLATSIPPKLSWAHQIDAEETVENACIGFGKWLEEQLALWEEDYEKSLWWTLSIPDVSTILMNWMRKGSLSIPITPPALANSWISGLKLSFKWRTSKSSLSLTSISKN